MVTSTVSKISLSLFINVCTETQDVMLISDIQLLVNQEHSELTHFLYDCNVHIMFSEFSEKKLSFFLVYIFAKMKSRKNESLDIFTN